MEQERSHRDFGEENEGCARDDGDRAEKGEQGERVGIWPGTPVHSLDHPGSSENR